VGKPEGRKPLRRLRLRWDDNIKMNQRSGMGYELDQSGLG
jgi:hypothetical protein